MDQVAADVESISKAVRELLDRVRALDPGADEAATDQVREAIVAVGRAGQVLHGLLLSLVGQGDRLAIARGGIGPWLATVLDLTEGRARALAHDARLLATVPQLEDELSSGSVGQDSARALARTVKAVTRTALNPADEVAQTLHVAQEQGAKAGLDRVRTLEEHLDPGSIKARHAQQRERSFARITYTAEDQMHRCEILLDPARGAILQAAIDLQVADMIRTRQYDQTEIVPTDVHTTEQMNAEAITRMAQVFLDASAEQRGARFSLPTLAVTMQNPAPEAEIPTGCARTIYGALIPAGLLPKQGNPRRHELTINAHTGTLDGTPVDRDPAARLASNAQRAFLTWRDRHCRYPGCDRPITFALHAHHKTPHAKGGSTTVQNLKLYCSQHHTVVHHQ